MIALISFLLSFVLSYLGTLGLLRLRLRESFVDIPNDRSSHEEPKPRLGGIAIVAAFAATYAMLLFAVPETRSFLPFLGAALLLFTIGVVDDWKRVPVYMRFGVQIVAALIIAYSGGIIDHIRLPMAGVIELGVVSVPFTVLFILTCINFFNFIDGIDGLAAGSAFIAASFIAFIAYMLGHFPLALLSLAVAGSSVGFLHFNFPPSRIFMGDGGSTFLGFFFAYVAIMGNMAVPELPIFLSVLILSSLFVDAGLTLVRRGLSGEKIFEAHHTHYYQRLLSLGLNHKQVTILEYAITIMLGVSAVIYFQAGGLFPIFLTACWVMVFTGMILKIRSLERGDSLFWEKRTLLVVGVDWLLITVSYVGAYFLRLNFRFTDPEGMAMLKALPIVLVVRSACFFWFGLYRGVWKYTSTEDLLRIIKAVTVGSAIILTSVVLLYRFVAFPRSLFVIEYFLLIVTIGGARFAFRVFHDFGKEAHGAGIQRIAIIGAGDLADRKMREIKHAKGTKINVVCFLDDDRDKIGLTLHGHPILGPINRLQEICQSERIDLLIMAISDLPHAKLQEITGATTAIGIPLEGAEGGVIEVEEKPTDLFNQITQKLGQAEFENLAADETSFDIKDFYRDKNVLVTGGGAQVAPALVHELANYGARVTMQVSSPAEAAGLDVGNTGAIRLFLGNLAGPTDLARLIDRSTPDIVFMNIEIDSPAVQNALNSEEYLWRRAMRETNAVIKILSGRKTASVNVLIYWDALQAGTASSFISAATEVSVLNTTDIAHASAAVVRFPKILTQETLMSLAQRRRDSVDSRDDSFNMFETKAVEFALKVPMSYKNRILLAPVCGRSYTSESVRQVISGNEELERTLDTGRRESRQALLFAAETSSPSRLRGMREVHSPIFPADNNLIEAVSRLALSTKKDVRSEALLTLTNKLQEKVTDELKTSIDESK
jgi:UDP-GlcNAc:undecaprenyl-phosphate GlcNAc-1-phosphate transferase